MSGWFQVASVCLSLTGVGAWPDGAPCLRRVIDFMNPLEASEHQGGLQLTEPPYLIRVDMKCYNPGTEVGVMLRGRDNNTMFKGFALQARVFDPTYQTATDERTGRFERDDNGSWRFQCFRDKGALTHSHQEAKNKIGVWWKPDEHNQYNYIQFIATVVHSQYRFWVKSIVSRPLPPCSQMSEWKDYQREAITHPPSTNWNSFANYALFSHDYYKTKHYKSK